MPTYQYACKDCDNAFETVQAFSDATLTECPQCHGNLRKVFNSVGVVFKGSGFYRTDSRSESNGKATIPSSSKESSDSGSSDSKGSSSSESKSDSTKKADSTTPAKKSEPAKAAASA